MVLRCIWVVAFAACSRSNNNPSGFENPSISIVDSIRVDYLGNLYVMDYDPSSQLYLSRNNGTDEIVLFDDSGTIKERFAFQQDGPHAVTSANGFRLALIEGKVVAMDHQRGILFFNQHGAIQKRIALPGEHFFSGRDEFTLSSVR
ncbi:hypothetical protein [Lunatimonas lonarensis]|uniref:hypothetical protein n=1 Tax=Lunatimonas lonarensis TaxID=1232681 RepID=UPI0012DE38E3|nr:hypothetical protein [Lunatimonas lonarensis]